MPENFIITLDEDGYRIKMESEDALYEIGYRHGQEGVEPIKSNMTTHEYRMGYEDGKGDREEANRFEDNQSLKTWYTETDDWQHDVNLRQISAMERLANKIGIRKGLT